MRLLPKHELPPVRYLPHRRYLEASQGTESPKPGDGTASLSALLGDARPTLSLKRVRLLASDGFYSGVTHEIYVLDDPSRRFPELQEEVVAHESIHALQHQNGLFPAAARYGSQDEALAMTALLEGDATLGVVLYGERGWHTPTERLGERVRRGFAEAPISRFVAGTHPDVAGAPAYQQEMALFPYRAGSAFVGAVLSAGGYQLLAKVYASPPRSTAEVLHPDRYARGERPIEVPSPRLPAGYQSGARYVLGELLTRSELLRCNPEARAIAAADGWRGDAVIKLTGASGTLTAQQWVLAAEADAKELAAALNTNRDCPNAAPSSSRPQVVQRGARVVSAEGAPPPVLSSLAESWLALPIPTTAPTPPLGETRLSPNEAFSVSERPAAHDGWLRFPFAGVELPIPPGFELQVSPGDGPRLEQKSTHAGIELELSLGEYFDAAPMQILVRFSRAMAASLAFSNVVDVGKPYAVKTEIGRAMSQDFEHDGTVFKGRALAVPLCGGAGMLTVLLHFGSGDEQAMIDAFAKLRALPGSTLCQRLTR